MPCHCNEEGMISKKKKTDVEEEMDLKIAHEKNT